MTNSTNMGGNSVWTNTFGIKFADGTQQITAFIEPTSGRQLFVDNGRTNAYVPDGTYLRPYSTIMDAVNVIIANGDNTGTNAYTIQLAPGVYNETVDLSNPKLVSLGINGCISGQNSGVIIGSPSLATPAVRAINNDNLLSAVFVNIRFESGMPTHGVQFSSTTSGTHLGEYGIVFRNCGFQYATSDVYFNNVSFVLFDDTGITPNVNITNVNLCEFTNSQGPDPSSTVNVVTDSGTATPSGWGGFTSVSFNSVGSPGGGAAVGNITCDASSSVLLFATIVQGAITTSSTTNPLIIANSAVTGSINILAGGTLGLVNSFVSQPSSPDVATVTVSGILLSSLSNISGTAITVNNGGVFVEEGGLHDDAQLTVEAGGEYAGQSDMATGSLSLFNHLNSQQEDLAGQLTITDGTNTSFTFSQEYTNAPLVVISPTNDPTAIGGYWVTSTNTGFTINIKNSGTMAFNYIVVGAGS